MTDLLLLLKFSETAERLLPTINGWLTGRGRLVHDEDPAVPRGWYGGSKYLQASVAFGAAEGVDVEAFVAFLKSLPWAVDDDVNAQLAVRKPGDAAFTLHKIFPVAGVAYAPAPPLPPMPPRVHIDVHVTLHYRLALGEAFAAAIVRPLAARLGGGPEEHRGRGGAGGWLSLHLRWPASRCRHVPYRESVVGW